MNWRIEILKKNDRQSFSLVKNHYSMLAYRSRYHTDCWLWFWQGLFKWVYLLVFLFKLLYFRTQDRGDDQNEMVQIWIETDENFSNGHISKLLVFFGPPCMSCVFEECSKMIQFRNLWFKKANFFFDNTCTQGHIDFFLTSH